MTASIDHLAAARAALDDARGTGPAAALHIARAQVHATLALAWETHTTNLIRSLDYVCAPVDMHSRDRLDEITARLWGTHPPVPPVSDEDVETLAGLVDEAGLRAVADASSRLIARRLLATGKVTVTTT